MTTTLYSLIRRHDAFTQNINSLEVDPLTELDNITQHFLDKGFNPKETYRRLESVLRSDPDVVLVGFCHSAEMAQVGTKGARMGKKLYFGMNHPSTFHALQQWLKMVDNNDKVAESLLAITAQKLLRKLCSECREAYTPDPRLLKKLNLPADRIKQFYRPPTEVETDKRGNPILCEECQGVGYVGRTAVLETLFVTDSLRELFRQAVPLNALRAQCRKERMLYLQEQALRKVIDGTTSIQEVLRITAEKPAKGAKKAGAPADKEKQEPQEKADEGVSEFRSTLAELGKQGDGGEEFLDRMTGGTGLSFGLGLIVGDMMLSTACCADCRREDGPLPAQG